MTLTVLENHQAIAIRAAKEIADAIREKTKTGKYFVLGLATGATMEPVYAELIRMHQEENLDFSHVKCFNLDNYVGLPKDDRNNYEKYLHDFFLKHVNVNPAHIDLVSSDADFDHQAYEKRIKEAGGIDIQLLGLGRKGHIGFNEVGSPINSLTREIELSEETKEDNGKLFNRIDSRTNQTEAIPNTAHTRGIAPILEAKKILCLANGHGKAQVVKRMCKAGSVRRLPARALHSHPNVMTLVDKDALALFDEDALKTHTNLTKKRKRRAVTKANQFHLVTLDIQGVSHELLLPPQFDFYNPKTMDIDEAFDHTNEAHLKDLADHLGAAVNISVGAHPDDAEIMAGPMMLEATKANPWLTIIMTNGAAANNTLNGKYSQLTPEALTKMRQKEQRLAAQFANVPVIMLNLPTPAITGDMDKATRQKSRTTMRGLFSAMEHLRTIYGHNPQDKHDTHVNVFVEQVEALRALSPERLKTIKIWGMEVWGRLHVANERLLTIPVDEKTLLKWQEMISFYQSQIDGQGRDYSDTTIYRARNHAGYETHPHGGNPPPGLILAADLTDLVQEALLLKNPLWVIDMISTLTSELNTHLTSKPGILPNDRKHKKRRADESAESMSTHFFSDSKRQCTQQEQNQTKVTAEPI
ncbi:MAG: 6-phosphogluconolactonase [Gammaproteobacteria bacterium]|nr:6-phosphogluconolactonase [Gammaproteobacteria bacterium]